MTEKIAGPAGPGDLTGSLLESELRFDSSENFATQPMPATATSDGLDGGAALAAGSATGGGDEAASLAGTTVQTGAAGGLVFNITYDSSVSSAPAGFTSAIAAVVSYYTSVLSDPITVNIHIGWGEVAGQALASGALGESLTNLGVCNCSQVRAAWAGDGTSAGDS